MGLTRGQVLSITVVILGVLMVSTSQLTDLFGASATKTIVSVASLLTSILSGINMALQGQGSQIQAVQAMPGVEKIIVNDKANSTLATMTVDPSQNKIEALPRAQSAVEATAAAAAA